MQKYFFTTTVFITSSWKAHKEVCSQCCPLPPRWFKTSHCCSSWYSGHPCFLPSSASSSRRRGPPPPLHHSAHQPAHWWQSCPPAPASTGSGGAGDCCGSVNARGRTLCTRETPHPPNSCTLPPYLTPQPSPHLELPLFDMILTQICYITDTNLHF